MSRAQIVGFASAWCSAHPDDRASARDAPVDRERTLAYWCARLAPLHGRDAHFVCADRVGREPRAALDPDRYADGEIQFCGCSCVLSLREPALVAALDDREEGVLIADIPVNAERAPD